MGDVYQVKVTGYEPIQANSPEEAVEIFDKKFIENGYAVRDLRWKVLSALQDADEKLSLLKRIDELERRVKVLDSCLEDACCPCCAEAGNRYYDNHGNPCDCEWTKQVRGV